jgi:hypothetical protein
MHALQPTLSSIYNVTIRLLSFYAIFKQCYKEIIKKKVTLHICLYMYILTIYCAQYISTYSKEVRAVQTVQYCIQLTRATTRLTQIMIMMMK